MSKADVEKAVHLAFFGSHGNTQAEYGPNCAFKVLIIVTRTQVLELGPRDGSLLWSGLVWSGLVL